MAEMFVYCHNVAGLFQAMACIYSMTQQNGNFLLTVRKSA